MKIIFDIDGVLNNLSEYTFELAGITQDKLKEIKYYSVSKWTELTENEKSRVLELWSTGSTFTGCSAQDGIQEIDNLAMLDGTKVIIHSLSYTEGVAQAKRVWLKYYIKSNKVQIILELDQKNSLDYADVIVEDNIEYLITCNSKTKILIDKPYNKPETYNLDDKTYGITRVNSLSEAIELIKEMYYESYI